MAKTSVFRGSTSKHLGVWILLMAILAILSGCSKGQGLTGPTPNDGWIPPSDPSPYRSFYEPINLSEDEVGLTLQFLEGTVTPPSGSTVIPVSMNAHENPCPKNCFQFRANLKISSLSPDVSRIFAKVKIYFSENGVNPSWVGGGPYLVGIGDLPPLVVSKDFGNMGQVPFIVVPTWFVVEWEYQIGKFVVSGNPPISTWVTEDRSGKKVIPTFFSQR